MPRLVRAGDVSSGSYGNIAMNGKEVYKFACSKVPDILDKALSNAGMTSAQVDWLLLHQANIRIIESVADRLGIPMSKARAAQLLHMRALARSTLLGAIDLI